MATTRTKKRFEGVETRGNSIRIKFTYRGVTCRETLKGFAATVENKRYAERYRKSILHEIAMGKFDYAANFPESARAVMFSGGRDINRTVEQALKSWLAIKEAELAHSTFVNYRSKADVHISPKWGHRLISEVGATEIETWQKVELSELKNKTINEIMIVMRGIFKAAKRDKVISENPIDDLDNLTVLVDEPDPFTKDEIKNILSVDTKRIGELNACGFNMYSGLRISELLALAWEDIDLEKWTVKIARANVKGRYKVPKTRSGERTVELLDQSIEWLKRQKEITYMSPALEVEVMQRDNKTIKKEMITPVFLNSNTGGLHNSDGTFRDRFWRTHLKRAKVRYRGPNHMRHTFASQLLTLGIPKEWIAPQMGHSSIRTLEKRYAKWIKEDSVGMSSFVSQILAKGAEWSQKGPSESHLGADRGTNALKSIR